MEAVVLHRVGFLAYFCPKQGQDFKPSAAPLYPNMGQVPPPPPPGSPVTSRCSGNEEAEDRKPDRTFGVVTVFYFPIFRQARPDFFRECLRAHEGRESRPDTRERRKWSIFALECTKLIKVGII